MAFLSSSSKDLHITELAEKIEADITTRRLAPGEPYLTTAECAKALGVGTALANRAMQMLSVRGLLKRSRRTGSIVTAPEKKSSHQSSLQKVTLIIESPGMSKGAGFHEEVLGSQDICPQASLNILELPLTGRVTYMQRVLHKAKTQKLLEGFILMSVSVKIQRLCLESGLPCILRGHPQTSLKKFPYVDRSGKEGYDLARHLLKNGGDGLLLLMREVWFPGDHLFIDAVLAAAAEANLPPGAVRICGLEADSLAMQCEVNEFLDGSIQSPAIIAQTSEFGTFAHYALRRHPKRARTALGIADCRPINPLLQRYTHLQFLCSVREVGRKAGTLLVRVANGQAKAGEASILPTHIVPGSSS